MKSGKYIAEKLELEATRCRKEAEKFANVAHRNIGVDASKGQSDPSAYANTNLVLAEFCDRLAKDFRS